MTTQSPLTIVQDGRVLHGTEWTTPDDYVDDDVASGNLVTLKGMTPVECPVLEACENG